MPALLPRFSELREESRLHQQYEAAVCTMDFTLMIDKFVERAQKVMDQGTLLAAHKVSARARCPRTDVGEAGIATGCVCCLSDQ